MYKELFKTTGLSLERLHSFCLVAKACGFNKAAGDNQYKQSQYSKQIADLEKFFGCPLFLRKGRTIELTQEGIALLEIINSFFTQLEMFKASKRNQSLNITISAGQSVIDSVLPSLINKEAIKLTKSISFRSQTTEESIKDVLMYNSHFAIISRDIKNKDLLSTKILSSKTAMICKSRNKNNFYTGDKLGNLAKNPTIILTGSGKYRESLLQAFSKHNLNITFEVPSFFAMKTFTEKGNAISYLPEYCLTPSDKTSLSVFYPEALSKITRDLYIICRKNLISSNNTLKNLFEIFTRKAMQ